MNTDCCLGDFCPRNAVVSWTLSSYATTTPQLEVTDYLLLYVHGRYDRARARNYAYVPMHGTNPSRDRANQNQSASHTFIRACMLTRHGGHDAAASTSGQAPSTSKPGSTESCLDPSPWKRKSPQPFRLTANQILA